METTRVVIDHPKVKSVLWNNNFIDTNREIEMTISDALRLSRLYNVSAAYPRLPYNPEHWQNKRFGFTGDADTLSGFGNCTVNLVKYSQKAGYDVRWVGRQINVPELNPLARKEIPLDLGMVWHEQPGDRWFASPFQRNIGLVPFETTLIPKSWVPRINVFDAMMVPCKQNIEMMQNSGVRIPIELIHWGVDRQKFYPVPRNNKVFTFGTMGALSTRKGTDILIAAFQAAFPKEIKDVKLICKTSFNVYPFMVKDDRIQVLMSTVTNQELLNEFAAKIDCFVFPTRGEGFGLPPLEMMATGVPAIVTNWSGPADYMTDEVGWKLDYKMVPATNFSDQVYKEWCGDWAEPSKDHLVELMRYAYNHPMEVKEKGEAAAHYVQNNWLWEQRMPEFFEALNKHL